MAVTDIAVGIEESNTQTNVMASNISVGVEETETTTYVKVSDIAVMVEWKIDTGDYCGPGDIGLTSYLQFSRGLHCYLSREVDEVGLSITGELTIGGWVFFGIQGRGHNTGIMGKWYAASDDRAYALYKENDNRVVFSISGAGTDTVSIDDQGISYKLRNWHYIVGRYKPSTELALFVDGKWYTKTTGIPASIHDSDEPFEIGRYDRNNYFDGRLCHMFVSAEAIDDVEIEAMYSHTYAMFNAPLEQNINPSGIVMRMTNAAVMVEYNPKNFLFMTNAAVMVEYNPPSYIRLTNAAAMIEYVSPDYIRVSNAAVMIEYVSPDYLRITNAAVMIEYSSSSSSSTSSSSSSSSTTSSSSSAPP